MHLWNFLLLFNLLPCIHARSANYSPANGRVGLFSKQCSASKGEGQGQGVCIFLWHCRSRGGTPLAPCRHGILFGTCCHFPSKENIQNPPATANSPIETSSVSPTGQSTSVQAVQPAVAPRIPLRTNVTAKPWRRRKPTTTIPNETSSATANTSLGSKTTVNKQQLESHRPQTMFTPVGPYATIVQSVIESLAEPAEAPPVPVEVSYVPHHHPIALHETTSSPTTTLMTHQVIDVVNPNLTQSADDFPLDAIQQIISDFAKQTPTATVGVTSSEPLPFWWTFKSTNQITDATDETNQPMTTEMSTESALKNPAVVVITTSQNSANFSTATPPVTKKSTTIQPPITVPSLHYPIISIHVSNSTSVVESAASFEIEEMSPHTEKVEGFLTELDVNHILESQVVTQQHLAPWMTTTITVTTPSTASNIDIINTTTTTKKLPATTKKSTPSTTTTTTPSTTPPVRRSTKRPTRRTTTKRSTTIRTTTTTKPWNYKTDCGVRPLAPTGRIVGGKKVVFGQWPWQVLIKEATWFGLVVKTKCGGVLISNKYVITAAHCQPGWLASLLVLLGEYDLARETGRLGPIQRNVRRVIAHRDFVAATFENDIALLEMDRAVDFQPHIIPVCLPPRNADYTGKMAFVSGWGRLAHAGPLPSVLHYVDVPIMSNNGCQEMFLKAGKVKAIKDSFLCAGYENGGKDSCEGDSGGPLTIQGKDGRWVLVGTVSHGIECASPNLPGVYTRISAFRDWIDKFVTS